MVVILLGPPGVGKGTQGDKLLEDLQWEKIATGDLLRAARREGTELGKEAQSYMDAGELVPDDVIVAMVEEKLASLPAETGVLFDGFPRTVPQARELARVLPKVDRELDAVILFEAPDQVLQKRISGRRHSPDSGRIYNIYFDPPEEEGICDEAGTALVHRDDDKPETVTRRLRVYREQTEPLVAHYRESETPVLMVDGDQEMDQVQADLRRVLSDTLGVEVSPA